MVLKRLFACDVGVLLKRFCSVALLSLFSAMLLIACGSSSASSLAAPRSLLIEGNLLSWAEVDDALQYRISIDSTLHTSKSNSLSLSMLDCNTEYTIKVMALGDSTNFSDSDWSEPTTFTTTSQGFSHSFASYQEHTAPTCLVKGTERQTCTRCAVFEQRDIPALGHTWVWETTLAPSETQDGTEQRSCSACDYTDNETRIAYATGTEGLIYVLNTEKTGYKVLGDPGGSAMTSATIHIPSYHNRLPVVEVSGGAFTGFSNLKRITIPDTVTHIGTMALQMCDQLEQIELPFIGQTREATGAQAVLGYLFAVATTDTTGATEQYYSEGETRSYLIPSTLRRVVVTDASQLSYGAFSRCSMLEEVEVRVAVGIEGRAFWRCSGLERVTVAGELVSIGAFAFENCDSLESISLADSIVSILQGAFKNCSSLIGVRFPESLSILGSEAFAYCTSLASARFSGGIMNIAGEELDESGTKGYTFRGCTSLKSIVLPKTLESVGDRIFSGSGVTAYVELGTTIEGLWNASWNGDAGATIVVHTAVLGIDDGGYYVVSVNKGGGWITNHTGTGLEPRRDGYTFTGWKSATGDIVGTTQELLSAANGKYTALWQPLPPQD